MRRAALAGSSARLAHQRPGSRANAKNRYGRRAHIGTGRRKHCKITFRGRLRASRVGSIRQRPRGRGGLGYGAASGSNRLRQRPNGRRKFRRKLGKKTARIGQAITISDTRSLCVSKRRNIQGAFHGQIEAILPASVWFKIKGLAKAVRACGRAKARGNGASPALRLSVRRPSTLPLDRLGIGLSESTSRLTPPSA